MRKLILLLVIFAVGCQGEDKRDYRSELQATIEKKKKENEIASTTALKECPVKIVKSYITHNTIGTPELHIVFKNTGKKVVDGIEVKTTCSNNFKEFLGFEYGIVQESLKPNVTRTFTWPLYKYETTTKVYSEIYKVHFKGE